MKTTSYKDIRARSITTPEAEQATAEQHALREQAALVGDRLLAAIAKALS